MNEHPTTSPDLLALIEEGAARWAALSPLDRALLSLAQRRSWVRGETGADPGEDPMVTEIQRLRARVDELLAANTREVERRRMVAALLRRALEHADRVSVLLNDLAAEMHDLDAAEPEGSTRFDAMSALLCRRFTDCSALTLMCIAEAVGFELPGAIQVPTDG